MLSLGTDGSNIQFSNIHNIELIVKYTLRKIYDLKLYYFITNMK